MQLDEIWNDKERLLPSPLKVDMNLAYSAWDVADQVEGHFAEKFAPNENGYKAVDIARNKIGKVMPVPAAEVVGSEKNLDHEHFHDMVNNRAAPKKNLPIVYKYKDQFVIGDGNHRFANAILHDINAQVNSLVIDLDRYGNLELEENVFTDICKRFGAETLHCPRYRKALKVLQKHYDPNHDLYYNAAKIGRNFRGIDHRVLAKMAQAKFADDELLSEVTPEHSRKLERSQWNDHNEIAKYLKGEGFELLGQGHYSMAFQKPGSNKIVKISKREDECWLKFAKWCKTQRNPYLPKVYMLKPYEWKHKNVHWYQTLFIAVVEELHSADPYMEKKILSIPKMTDPVELGQALWLSRVYSVGVQPNSFTGSLPYSRLIDQSVLKMAKKSPVFNSPDFEGLEDYDILDELMKAVSQTKLIKTLHQFTKLHKDCALDVHGDNIMIRPGTNQLVFSDPVAYKASAW